MKYKKQVQLTNKLTCLNFTTSNSPLVLTYSELWGEIRMKGRDVSLTRPTTPQSQTSPRKGGFGGIPTLPNVGGGQEKLKGKKNPIAIEISKSGVKPV